MSYLFLELKYARMVGPRLLLWKVKKNSPFHGNARCPICLDSATSKSKCRFHVTEHDGMVFCSCFNCGYKNSLANYMKVNQPDLYHEFVFEKYRIEGKEDSGPIIKIQHEEPVKTPSKRLKHFLLPRVSELPETHFCAEYVRSRRIPEYEFYYADKFFEFAREFKEDISSDVKDGPRLVIPFFDKSGNIYAFQGRDLTNKSSLKYITISVDKKVPKIFGLDRLDKKEHVNIVEGPIDSLFLPNCIASVNASLIATARKIEPVINKSQVTLIFDNEPRNRVIVGHYEEAVKLGYKIVIWPGAVDGIKDINDMYKAGINVLSVVNKNTFSGLIAQLELNKWKKI